MLEISKIRTQKNCEKKGNYWQNGKCVPLTLKNLMTTDLENFCRITKGELHRIGESLTVGAEGIKSRTMNICGFNALHWNNDRGNTSWVPAIDTLEENVNGEYVKYATKTAHDCAKNNTDAVVGTWNDVEEELKAEGELKGLSKEDKDKRIQSRIDADMEMTCQDAWNILNHKDNDTNTMTGFWKGDEHDNYDIGEKEWLFTSDMNHAYRAREDITEADFNERTTFNNQPYLTLTALPDEFNRIRNSEGMYDAREILRRYRFNETIGFMEINIGENKLSFNKMRIK